MTDSDELRRELSLLRCTLKKSLHTSERLLVYAAYAIVAISAIVGAYLLCTALVPFGEAVLRIAGLAIQAVITALASVPLWIYGVAAVPVAIVGHSFLWCVARDLGEDDWKSDAANAFAAFAAIAAFAFVAAFTVAAFTVAAVAAFAFVTAFTVAAFTVAAFAIDPVDKITIWYFIFRFPGAAWHHYRKQQKQGE